MTYELHIDLLKCEFCGQHNKLLAFCSACARARKSIIIAPPDCYRLDHGNGHRCTTCFTQHRRGILCIYCKPRTALGQRKKRAQLPAQTHEQLELDWFRICRERSKKKGKKAHSYRYGKELATNMAAPFIARLRAEIGERLTITGEVT